MKKIFYFIIFALFMSACSAFRVSYDYDRKADFGIYKSFAFEKKALENFQMNDLDKRRMIKIITKELNAKGISKTELDADLHVKIFSFTKDKLNTYYYDDSWPMWGRWRWSWWGGVGMGRTYTYQYNEGSIVIDVLDAKKNILIWQGRGSGINVEDLNSKKEAIEKLVHKLFKKFPPIKK